MTRPAARKLIDWARPPLWLPALVLLLLTLPSIGRGDGFSPRGFKPDDTAWYSAIAVQTWRDFAEGKTELPGWELFGPRAMVDTGEKGPMPIEVPYYNKPPLAFVVHGFFLWLLGAIPAAARLPSILAAAATVWVVTRIGSRAINLQAGVTCGLALALTLEFVRHTQAFSLDLWLTLFSACATWAVVAARDDSPRHIHCLVTYAWFAGVMIGLSLLTKPLVGLIMVPIFLAWLILERPASTPRWSIFCIAITFTAAVVAFPWHWLMNLGTDGVFMDQYFGREIADRAAGGISNLNQDAGNPLYYLAILGETYWPWLAACIVGAWAALRPMHDVPIDTEAGVFRRRAHSLMRLGLMAAMVWLVVLSVFPDKRPRYLLVAYPFMAMLAGAWIDWAAASGRYVWLNDVRRFVFAWCLPAAAVLGVVLAVADPGKPRDKQYDELLTWLETQPGAPWWDDRDGLNSAMRNLYIGGFSGQRAAVLYLETGLWPVPTDPNNDGERLQPNPGALIVYHVRDGLAPGSNEEAVFRSGDLTVTRLRELPWEPQDITDPGEQ